MAKKLYIGNLAYRTTADELRDLFSEAGDVVEAVVITDRESGRSKGFGFVEMDTEEQAQEAIRRFNGYALDTRNLNVREALPRPERDRDRGPRPPRREGGGNRERRDRF